MSIQTEIDRLASAKAAIKTAIEGKGVTVPSDTLLSGMAALIESIVAGGGGGSFNIGDYDIIETGSIIPTSSIGNDYVLDTGITIQTEEQAKNTLLIVFLDYVFSSFYSAIKTLLVGMGGRNNRIIPSFSVGSATYFNASFSTGVAKGVINMSESYPSTEMTLKLSSSIQMLAGATYRWILLSKSEV